MIFWKHEPLGGVREETDFRFRRAGFEKLLDATFYRDWPNGYFSNHSHPRSNLFLRKFRKLAVRAQEGVLSSKADEVARNGALARITSARGFLGTPLAFPVGLQFFDEFEISPELFLSAR